MATCNRALPFHFCLLDTIINMSLYFVQPRFEKTCENICVCEKHSRNNTFQCHRRCQHSRQLRHSRRSCHARRSDRTRYPARQQTKPTRYTAHRTYQAHALFSAATAKPIALYSAANAPGSRAIQRGDRSSEDDGADDELSLFSERLFNV